MTTVKNPAANAEDAGAVDLIPGSRRSPGGEDGWLPTPTVLSGESHGQRSLVGYGPWGRKSQMQLKQCSMHAAYMISLYIIHTIESLCSIPETFKSTIHQ